MQPTTVDATHYCAERSLVIRLANLAEQAMRIPEGADLSFFIYSPTKRLAVSSFPGWHLDSRHRYAPCLICDIWVNDGPRLRSIRRY